MIGRETEERALDFVILYDNLRAGQRAKELCDRVACRLGTAYEMKFHFWKFAMLGDLFVVRVVTIQIMSAPCLIVACHGNDTLAQPVELFLRQSARAMHAAGAALVAQLHGIHGGNEEQLPAFRCLREIAAIAGIPFFSEVIEPVADKANSANKVAKPSAARHLDTTPTPSPNGSSPPLWHALVVANRNDHGLKEAKLS